MIYKYINTHSRVLLSTSITMCLFLHDKVMQTDVRRNASARGNEYKKQCLMNNCINHINDTGD